MRSDDTMAALAADLEQLRAMVAQQQDALAQQRAVIAQQQAAINALQHSAAASAAASVGSVVSVEAGRSAPTLKARAGARATGQDAADAASGAGAANATGKRGKLGRRGLLLGAAGVAGATVATAAAVAISDPQSALAAPLEPKGADGSLATGDALLLGESNDADQTTYMINSLATTPSEILDVELNEPGSGGIAIFGGAFTSTDAAAAAAAARKAHHSGFALPGEGTGGGGGSGGVGAGWGVYGASDLGFGVVASSGFIDLTAIGMGRIWQIPQGQVGAPGGPSYFAGESIRDANGDLWLCVSIDQNGNPVWERVGVVAPGFSGGAISYLTHPIRLLDTRKGTTASSGNQIPQKPCTASTPFTVFVEGVNFGGIQLPSTVVGAIGNVTVVEPTAPGYLSLVPSGVGFQGASNLNYVANVIVPNFFTVGLSPSNATTNPGCFDIIVAAGTPAVDVLIDLVAIVI